MVKTPTTHGTKPSMIANPHTTTKAKPFSMRWSLDPGSGR